MLTLQITLQEEQRRVAADRRPNSHLGAGELGDLRSAPSGPEAGSGITHTHTQWPETSECGCL